MLEAVTQQTIPLTEAYRQSLEEQEILVRQAELPLVQDLHLFDAETSNLDSDFDALQIHSPEAACETD